MPHSIVRFNPSHLGMRSVAEVASVWEHYYDEDWGTWADDRRVRVSVPEWSSDDNPATVVFEGLPETVIGSLRALADRLDAIVAATHPVVHSDEPAIPDVPTAADEAHKLEQQGFRVVTV